MAKKTRYIDTEMLIYGGLLLFFLILVICIAVSDTSVKNHCIDAGGDWVSGNCTLSHKALDNPNQ